MCLGGGGGRGFKFWSKRQWILCYINYSLNTQRNIERQIKIKYFTFTSDGLVGFQITRPSLSIHQQYPKYPTSYHVSRRPNQVLRQHAKPDGEVIGSTSWSSGVATLGPYVLKILGAKYFSSNVRHNSVKKYSTYYLFITSFNSLLAGLCGFSQSSLDHRAQPSKFKNRGCLFPSSKKFFKAPSLFDLSWSNTKFSEMYVWDVSKSEERIYLCWQIQIMHVNQWRA